MESIISLLKKVPILNMVRNFLVILPSPVNLSMMWNFGSILGMFLMVQIVSGLFLSMHYCPNVDMAFNSVIHIIQDVNWGWLVRLVHMNGASFYFISMYMHVGRGLYYHSFKFVKTWIVGVVVMLLSMMTAFLGYVLPWGQMSFWGATVITNLLSAIPYMGEMVVQWLWGGFSINNSTLNRFYSFHFLLPFVILFMVLLHLMFLHDTGSNNPVGLDSDNYKVSFHSFYSYKDLLGFFIIMMIFFFVILQCPYMLSDPDNFIPANSLVTPVHIQPEWYFLFAYAILRSIPNKLGGVLALFLSILILLILPILDFSGMKGSTFYFLNQIMFWLFVNCFLILTWVGSQPIEYPYVMISQISALMYFLYFISVSHLNKMWDFFLFT